MPAPPTARTRSCILIWALCCPLLKRDLRHLRGAEPAPEGSGAAHDRHRHAGLLRRAGATSSGRAPVLPLRRRVFRGTRSYGGATLALIGDMKKMSTDYIRAACVYKYGVSLFVGIGVPFPVLDESCSPSLPNPTPSCSPRSTIIRSLSGSARCCAKRSATPSCGAARSNSTAKRCPRRPFPA
jgi:hypothetical protein